MVSDLLQLYSELANLANFQWCTQFILNRPNATAHDLYLQLYKNANILVPFEHVSSWVISAHPASRRWCPHLGHCKLAVNQSHAQNTHHPSTELIHTHTCSTLSEPGHIANKS